MQPKLGSGQEGVLMDSAKASVSTMANIVEFMREVRDATTDNLPTFTKQTNVVSSVYVQQSLAAEDIMVPLLDTLNQIYVSYVLSALNLNGYIAGGRRLKDLLRTVSAEGFLDIMQVIDERFHKVALGGALEAGSVDITTNNQRLSSTRLVELTLQGRARQPGEYTEKETNDGVQDDERTRRQYSVYMYVQLLGHSVSEEVVDGFVSLNFQAPMWQRIRQLQAGEISFFKDFILAQDQVEKHKAALQNDKDHALRDMLVRQQKSANKSVASMLLDFGTERNHNCANTILIADEATFAKACNAAGLDFTNVADRNKFFASSYTMIVVTVDTMFNKITMYFNGIAGRGEYTFAQINKSARGGESVDIKDVMTMLGKGMSPKI